LYIGQLGEDIVSTTIRDILPSFSIPVHDITVNGSDIKIFYDGRLIGKFEVLNFNSSSYIDSKRALSIKENLKGIKYKGLICSFYNATSKANRILRNIPKCAIGFQLLPSKFHQYYVRLNKVHHRRIANRRSLKVLKNILKSFFLRIGLDLLMYVSRISRTRMYVPKGYRTSNRGINRGTNNKNTNSKNDRTGKSEGKSTVSESFRPKSFKSSSTFVDKLGCKIRRIPKFIAKSLSIFEPFLTVLSRLWNDTSGNVSLTKRSWKSKGGFQVSENHIQTRLAKHTYPCKYKVQIVCTKNRKIKYLCKASYRIDWNRLWFYNNMLYCKCHDIPEREGCIQHDAFCFYNMNRDLIDECPWSRSRMSEKWMYEDSLKRKMKEEMILEKINKNKIGMVKHD
jgi:hypothetical protein